MTAIWEKIKNKISGSAASIKIKTENVAKTVASKTPEMAENVASKTREVTSTVSEKTEEAVHQGKLRIKLHNLNSSVEKTFSEIGGKAYEILSKKKNNVYDDESIKTLIKHLEELQQDIRTLEDELQSAGIKEIVPNP